MKFQIKNNTHRTKAFKVWGGTEDVLPGKKRVIDIEGDVSDEFIERMAADGVEMKPAGKAKAEPSGGDQTLTAVEVLAMAGGNFMAFKSAASKLLGDATPSKKDEIVAALEDLATKP